MSAIIAQARDALDWATLVLAALTALGTVGAVLAALFLPRIEQRRLQPELTLSLAPKAMGIPLDHGDHERVAIRIHNAPGRQMARDVEVRVLAWTALSESVYILAEDDALLVDTGADTTHTTVPPGHARAVTLATFGMTSSAEDNAMRMQASFEMAHAQRSPMTTHWLHPTYITVTGSNFDAIVYEGVLGFSRSKEPVGVEVVDIISFGWIKAPRRVPEIPPWSEGAATISGPRV